MWMLSLGPPLSTVKFDFILLAVINVVDVNGTMVRQFSIQ